MEQFNMATQMMAFQRTAYDNCLNALEMAYKQGENIVKMSIDQTTWWLPQEGKRAIREWLGQLNGARTEFLQVVDENFKKFQSIFAADETPPGEITAKARKS